MRKLQLQIISSVLASALLIFADSPTAFAQTIKVGKVKGKRAIVTIVDGDLESGQEYSIGGGDSAGGKSSGGAGRRQYSIGATAGYSSTSTSITGQSSTSTSVLSAAITYGWNKGKMEYGPILSISQSSASGGGSSATLGGVGGFFDYNFTPNKAGVKMIPYIGGSAVFGSASLSGVSTPSISYIGIAPEGGVKYFGFGNATAVVLNASYSYRNYNSNPAATQSVLGFGLGLRVYY